MRTDFCVQGCYSSIDDNNYNNNNNNNNNTNNNNNNTNNNKNNNSDEKNSGLAIKRARVRIPFATVRSLGILVPSTMPQVTQLYK